MKIALIGSAPSSVGIAPYASPEWHIWGCSPGAFGVQGCRENAEAWFEIHRYEPGQPWFSEGYCNFLENFAGPVYMAEYDPRVKNCVPLPWRELVEKYGPYFFNSTISWMFAMAIEAQAKKIGLYGIDMAASEEYFSQKMGCIYFAQLAKSLGIEVGVPPESDLFVPPPLYGICEVGHQFIKDTQRARELNQRLAEAEQLVRAKSDEVHFLRGALDDLQYHQQTWAGNVPASGRQYCEPAKCYVPEPVQEIKPDFSAGDTIKTQAEYTEEMEKEAIRLHQLTQKRKKSNGKAKPDVTPG